MRKTRMRIRLCWRHRRDLYLAAFGCLLDLTGREYPRRARRILDSSRECNDCTYPRLDPPSWPDLPHDAAA